MKYRMKKRIAFWLICAIMIGMVHIDGIEARGESQSKIKIDLVQLEVPNLMPGEEFPGKDLINITPQKVEIVEGDSLPNETVQVETMGIEVASITWKDGDQVIPAAQKVEYAKQYTADIQLKLKENYKFGQNVSVQVNGNVVEMDGQFKLSCQFQTPQGKISSIQVLDPSIEVEHCNDASEVIDKIEPKLKEVKAVITTEGIRTPDIASPDTASVEIQWDVSWKKQINESYTPQSTEDLEIKCQGTIQDLDKFDISDDIELSKNIQREGNIFTVTITVTIKGKVSEPPTPTSTPTPTVTPTSTPTPTVTPTSTPTPTVTPTSSPAPTVTPTSTPGTTVTPTSTPTPTVTPTSTPTPTVTPTSPTPTVMPTSTPKPTVTPTVPPVITGAPPQTPSPAQPAVSKNSLLVVDKTEITLYAYCNVRSKSKKGIYVPKVKMEQTVAGKFDKSRYILKYISSNTKIASVSQAGKIRGLKMGQADITLCLYGRWDTSKVLESRTVHVTVKPMLYMKHLTGKKFVVNGGKKYRNRSGVQFKIVGVTKAFYLFYKPDKKKYSIYSEKKWKYSVKSIPKGKKTWIPLSGKKYFFYISTDKKGKDKSKTSSNVIRWNI